MIAAQAGRRKALGRAEARAGPARALSATIASMAQRDLSLADRILIEAQRAVDSVFGEPAANRGNPAQGEGDIVLDEVERRTMWMSVWHSDMFGRNDFLGEVMMPLHGLMLDDPSPKWYSLSDRVSTSHFLGTSFCEREVT